jgi:hypothetical protein
LGRTPEQIMQPDWSAGSVFNSDREAAYLRVAPAERHDAGRSRREAVPLEALVETAPETGRTDPLAILAE